MRKTVGVLAHVDAGKTTLSEQILFRSGAIRSLGRVDHADAFLDLHPVERERGVTVFSDQAVFDWNGNRYYWLDTPGHADFSAEMERALGVMDFAVLVIDCAEGVQSHTENVWHLLEEYRVPSLIFINKTDRPGADVSACIAELRRLLSEDIVDLSGFDGERMDESVAEAVAERDEALLNRLLEGGFAYEDWRAGLAVEIRERRIFPAFSGSALTGVGIGRFLAALDAVTDTDYEAAEVLPFASRVYKIRHDGGARTVYFKVLQGRLRVKDVLATVDGCAKVNELRLCHGARLMAVSEAHAGDLVCCPGLSGLRVGDGLGTCAGEAARPHVEPMLEAAVLAGPDVPPARLEQALRELEEEDPSLHLARDADGAPCVRVMGRMQIEILARLLADRYGICAGFGSPRILYKETIAAPVVGVGHYEPLKHYAEVWLRLSPLPRGSGIRFASRCGVDELTLNWQRLIETHVFERSYPGVLIGAPLTDVCVELLAGRAHLKHTEGGDFREATCRAIRNALMQARSVLLEPVCRFSLRMPAEAYGRVSGELVRMRAEMSPPEALGEWMRLEGTCPYARFLDYPERFRAQTRGRGAVRMDLSHYAPADDAAEMIEAARYNPLAADTPDSVFCSHGAGHIVPWNEVRAHAHLSVELPVETLPTGGILDEG